MLIRKRSIGLFFIFLLIILISVFEIGFSKEEEYKMWKPENNIEINKLWKIKFNNSLDITTIKDNIKLMEVGSKEYINVDLQYNESDTSIVIKPLNAYEYDKEYLLVIEKGLKSLKDKNISQGIKFNFKMESSEVESIGLLRDNFTKPDNDISSLYEFYNALAYALANFESTMTLNISNYNKDIYKLDVINKVLHNHPNIDYGYAGARGTVSSYKYSTNAVMNITFQYNYSKEDMVYMKKESQNRVKEIIAKVVKPSMSDYDKELALHDYLLENAEYDQRFYYGNMPEESYSDYGTLVKGTGVCDSYAKAMYRLLNTAGIETLYVTGNAIDGDQVIFHAWNIVRLDGEYYNLDPTWNDPIIYGKPKGETRHTYFNLTDEELSKDHMWDESKYPKSEGNKYKYN